MNSTAPLQWIPARAVSVWAHNGEAWSSRLVPDWVLSVTHNGDIDAWCPHNEMISNRSLVIWLEKVLSVDSPTQQLDSYAISGVLNLLHAQGVWLHAVRCAYYLAVVESTSDEYILPQEKLQAWADVFEEKWSVLAQDFDRIDTSIETVVGPTGQLEDEVVARLKAVGVLNHISGARLRCFVRAAVRAFFYHDTYFSLRYFAQHTHGTYAISASSSMYPARISLAAHGQPLSIGFVSGLPSCAWASVDACMGLREVSKEHQMKFRFDMRDDIGEIVELVLHSPEHGSKQESATEVEAFSNPLAEDSDGSESVHPTPTRRRPSVRYDSLGLCMVGVQPPQPNEASTWFHPNESQLLQMRGESLFGGKRLELASFQTRRIEPNVFTSKSLYDHLGSSIHSTAKTLMCRPQEGNTDPIASDIQDIPR